MHIKIDNGQSNLVNTNSDKNQVVKNKSVETQQFRVTKKIPFSKNINNK